MPKPLLLDPSLPAHRTHAARVGFENGIAFRFKLTMLPPRATSGFPLLIPQLHTKIAGAPAWRSYSPFSDWREPLLCRWIQVAKIFCFGPRNFDSIDSPELE